MILTCEDCHTRYLLPTHLLGADGRRVRCTICGHEWFQIPEDEDVDGGAHHADDGELSFAEILQNAENPDSVKRAIPDHQMLATEVIPAEKKSWLPARLRGGMVQGILAALLVAAVLLAVLVMVRGPLMAFWPNSLAFYQVIGLEPPIPGEGLVFEDLKATTSYNAQGVEILRLTGTVRNMRDHPVAVPGLRFALRREDGSEVETWSYPSPKVDIAPGSTIPLSAEYPQIADDVKELNVRFVDDQ